MATKPSFPGTPVGYAVKLQAADSTTFKDFITGPTGGVMLGRVRAASDDTNAVILQFALNISAVDYVLGEVNVPAGSGTNGTTPWVDVLAQLNLDDAMNLIAAHKLRVRAKTAVTAAKTIDLVAEGGQF